MKTKYLFFVILFFAFSCSPEPPLQPTDPIQNEEETEMETSAERQLTVSTSARHFDDIEDSYLLERRHYILVYDDLGEVLEVAPLVNDTIVTLTFNTDNRYHLTFLNYSIYIHDHTSVRTHGLFCYVLGDYQAESLHLTNNKSHQPEWRSTFLLFQMGQNAPGGNWRASSNVATTGGDSRNLLRLAGAAAHNSIFVTADHAQFSKYVYRMFDDVEIGASLLVDGDDMIAAPVDTFKIPDSANGKLKISGIRADDPPHRAHVIQTKGLQTIGAIRARFPQDIFAKFRTQITMGFEGAGYTKIQVGESLKSYFPEPPERQIINDEINDFTVSAANRPAVALANYYQFFALPNEELRNYSVEMYLLGDADAMPPLPQLTDSLFMELDIPPFSYANFEFQGAAQKTYSDGRAYDAVLEANYLHNWDYDKDFNASANFLEEGFMEIKSLR